MTNEEKWEKEFEDFMKLHFLRYRNVPDWSMKEAYLQACQKREERKKDKCWLWDVCKLKEAK